MDILYFISCCCYFPYLYISSLFIEKKEKEKLKTEENLRAGLIDVANFSMGWGFWKLKSGGEYFFDYKKGIGYRKTFGTVTYFKWRVVVEPGKDAIKYMSEFKIQIDFGTVGKDWGGDTFIIPNGNSTYLFVKIKIKGTPIYGEFLEESTSMTYFLDTGPIPD